MYYFFSNIAIVIPNGSQTVGPCNNCPVNVVQDWQWKIQIITLSFINNLVRGERK